MKPQNLISHFALSLLTIFLSVPSIASDKTEMVSKDKLLAVSMLTHGNFDLSDQVPGAFRDIDIPESLEPFAKIDFGQHFSQLVFVSSEPAEKVTKDLVSRLVGGGWKVPLHSGSGMRMTGFVSAAISKVPQRTYCHPDAGSLQYLFKDGENGAIGWMRITLKQIATPYSTLCGGSQSQGAVHRLRSSLVHERFPILVVPEGTAELPGMIGGGGGGGASYSSTTTIKTKLSGSALRDHFADQLEFQDWSEGAGWSIDGADGSVWEQDVDDKRKLIGMLTVASEAGGKYWLRFFVQVINK